ncbi:MAG TPA: polymer-forming cytoskeletal protein [Polyangiaceae bacterium]|nr:polymer-forming cytoskeletal protein [Polyangiaceae bacterium]
MSSSNSINPTSKRTVVEEGTHFTGNLTSTCPIDVRGRVEGDVQAPSLTVSARGAVHGHAKVGSVHSEGELSGEFEADTVELSGTVKDKTVIRARSLEVRLTSPKGHQVIFGDCELSVGDEPTEHDRVEEPAPAALAVVAEAAPEVPVAPADVDNLPAPVAEAPAASNEPALHAVSTEDPEEAHDEESVASSDDDKPVANSIEEALASEAEAPDTKAKGKGKGKRKENGGEATSGWSQPPSQPPPAG